MALVTVAPAKPRRVLEIILLLVALAVGIGGYVLTNINRTGELPGNLAMHAGICWRLRLLPRWGCIS